MALQTQAILAIFFRGCFTFYFVQVFCLNYPDFVLFRLHGCYLAIQAGHVKDALVDFTGGLSETFNLRRKDNLPPDLYQIVQHSFQQGSLLGTCIWVGPAFIQTGVTSRDLYMGKSSIHSNRGHF